MNLEIKVCIASLLAIVASQVALAAYLVTVIHANGATVF